jgi:hypothetical protein
MDAIVAKSKTRSVAVEGLRGKIVLNRFDEHPLLEYYEKVILYRHNRKPNRDELLFTWTAELTGSEEPPLTGLSTSEIQSE